MPVVAAAMHDAGVARAVREIVLFVQGEGIHVGAQTNGARAVALAQDADDPGASEPAVDFESVGGKFAGDKVGGARFLV